MKIGFKNILTAAALGLSLVATTGCTGDLDVENINPQQVSDFNQKAVFNKVYANLALTGIKGPDGSGDIQDFDEGFSSLSRILWNANELTTDEAHCTWGDAGIPEWNHNQWSDSHAFMQGLYYRLYFGITIANFYLEQATGTYTSNIPNDNTPTQRAEVRFLRAYYYSLLMDLFGNVPFSTTVSSEAPQQISRADLFAWIESELKAVAGETESDEVLPDEPIQYGRVNKAAAYMLLSRNYLNAEVYTGTAQWTAAKEYAQKTINQGYYSLCQGNNNAKYSDYQLLFMGDNETNGAQKEIILPAILDGATTKSWGGSLFLIASTVNSAMTGALKDVYPIGTSEAWGGNHCRKQFVEKFFPNDNAPASANQAECAAAAEDDRALFYTTGHTLDITDESDFTKGYAYVKYVNTHSDGSAVNDPAGAHTDTDVPMLRLAEAYLNFAEADARLNGGKCSAEGLEMIKALRTRAHAYSGFSSFSLSDIEDEWSKEFGFEGMRRPVLIRFNHFGGQNEYKWQWMGGVEAGASFDAHYNIFAIPSSDLNANSNLKQNPGY